VNGKAFCVHPSSIPHDDDDDDDDANDDVLVAVDSTPGPTLVESKQSGVQIDFCIKKFKVALPHSCSSRLGLATFDNHAEVMDDTPNQ
jgi:hypothetical protein